jgi:hypothetical protein
VRHRNNHEGPTNCHRSCYSSYSRIRVALPLLARHQLRCIPTVATFRDLNMASKAKPRDMPLREVNSSSPLDKSRVSDITATENRSSKAYRHVAVVHSKPRTSCLSHDSQVAPSFLGFRNLMVLVLGRLNIHNLLKRSQLVKKGRQLTCHVRGYSCYEPAPHH